MSHQNIRSRIIRRKKAIQREHRAFGAEVHLLCRGEDCPLLEEYQRIAFLAHGTKTKKLLLESVRNHLQEHASRRSLRTRDVVDVNGDIPDASSLFTLLFQRALEDDQDGPLLLSF